VTAGGRVLTVVGRGSGFHQAIERAYAGVAAISFSGMQFRRDIGAKAL
jgi:phosphoribosylamine---glycine ligase